MAGQSNDRYLQALITIVVGLALLPVIREFVANAINGSSASEEILLGLISLFWVLALIYVVIKMVK